MLHSVPLIVFDINKIKANVKTKIKAKMKIKVDSTMEQKRNWKSYLTIKVNNKHLFIHTYNWADSGDSVCRSCGDM